MRSRSRIAVVLLLSIGAASQGAGPSEAGSTSQFALPAAETVLRLARSDDGVRFTDMGRTFVAGAAAPDLTRLPDGELLALFDYWVEHDRAGRTVLAVSRSRDDGKSWSPLKLLRLRGPDGRMIAGRHGDLVALPGGGYRLYFATGAPPTSDHRAEPRIAIRSAIARDRLEFQVDDREAPMLVGPADLHPTAVRLGDRVHLYAAALAYQGRSEAGDQPIRRAYSRNGRRFKELDPPHVPPVGFVGSLLATSAGLRAYVATAEGIRSMASFDGDEWVFEEGLRLPTGWDPAVAQLEDGSYLMIYCAAAVPASGQAGGRAVGTVTGPDGTRISDIGPDTLPAVAADSPVDFETPHDKPFEAKSAEAMVSPLTEQQLTRLDEDVPTDGIDPLEPETFADFHERTLGDWLEDGASADGLGLAPAPDFRNPIDYLEWFEQNLLDPVVDGAFDAYATFMPQSLRPAENEVQWPELINMFNDDGYDGPPGPWDPAAHPEWEASSQAAQEVLDRFHEAGLKNEYGYRPLFSDEPTFETFDGQPLLMNLLLPSLSPHRDLAKATLADAWREVDGQVSQQRMLEAMETTLRNADHLTSGPTLIESLVATAERKLVQENARWALHRGVFDESGLEDALDLLAERDRDDTDPIKWIRGEHAVGMQTVQYIFDNDDVNRREQIAAKMSLLMDTDAAGQEALDAIADMDRNDAREALDAFDSYYHEITEQMRTGYPEVRAADMDATLECYRDTNALTRVLMPSLSRVQVIRTRNEASRRATQLAYATHLYRARTGDWPASLAELPEEYGSRMRTDPFTGDDFGYRLTDNGPLIYSASENGLDDDGVHSPRWSDEITNQAGSDDHVFWPPQRTP